MQKHGIRWIIAGMLLLIVFVSCEDEKKKNSAAGGPGGGGGGGRGNQTVQAEGFIVRTKPLSENLEVPGTLLPYESTEIRPEISGRVVKLNIHEGSFVQ